MISGDFYGSGGGGGGLAVAVVLFHFSFFWIYGDFPVPVAVSLNYCFGLLIYLPMCYLYGKSFVGKITPTVLSVRKEICTEPYHEEDLCYPHPLIQDLLWTSLHKFVEPVMMHWPGTRIREKALRTLMDHIHYEDENTRYICIGSSNKALNMLCCWVENPNSDAFNLHLPRVHDYLWLAEDGMKMQKDVPCRVANSKDSSLPCSSPTSTPLFRLCPLRHEGLECDWKQASQGHYSGSSWT